MLKVLRIVLLIVLLVVVVVLVGGFAFYWDTTRGPLPQHSGTLTAPGLAAEVEIIRDAYGIPHIYASSPADLFFAQGFTQAQDRWWQMEFNRHIGQGAIQRLTGRNEALMGNDIFIRTVGWYEAARRDFAALPAETQSALTAFANGVNAYITSRPADKLALEYRILGITGVTIPIEPWTPIDTVVWGKVMAWNLTSTFGRELIREEIVAALGETMNDDYTPRWPYGESFTIVQPTDLPLTDDSIGEAAVARLTRTEGISPVMAGGIIAGQSVTFGPDGNIGIGSNNWVATGSMTESGSPLLANDPHLGIQMPAIWYQVGLHCLPQTADCPYNVVGFALPSVPGIVIGHNDRIAWGVTNVGADVQDTYRLTVNPDNPLQYEWDGAWRDMTVRDEDIRFGDGGEPLRIQVRETHLGPVINDNDYDSAAGTVSGFTDEPLVLRWNAGSLAGEEGTLLNAVLRLNQAQNWTEFRAALTQWDVASQNIVYADVDGNIGYQMPGRIPIRPVGNDGQLPTDANDDGDVWQGFIPFDALPRIFNPEREYIVTANQAVVPLEYYAQAEAAVGIPGNYMLSEDWAYGQRGDRINALITELAPLSVEDYVTIHGDNLHMEGASLIEALNAVDLQGDTEALRGYLQGWDFQNEMDSGEAALFALFTRALVRGVFVDQLPEGIQPSAHQLFPISQMLDDPDNTWWDDASTTDRVENRDDILRRSLETAGEEAVALMGSNRESWTWGALHTATFVSNPLGLSGIDLIEGMVNRGPVQTSGGSDIVNATGWDMMSDDFTVGSLPSMRLIVDLTNLDATRTIITTGQSGHPFSEDYGNMIDLWRNIRYVPLHLNRDTVEDASVDRLVLRPS